MKKIHLILALLIFTVNLHSQTITFLDISNNKPILDVFVYNNHNQSVLSNRKGKTDMATFVKDSIIIQHSTYVPMKIMLPEHDSTIHLFQRTIAIEEIIYTVSKHAENKKEVPFQVDLLQRKSIEATNITNSADLLEEKGSVLIQKTQGGGGSPIIRGFEANKLLLVIDGVRMNNAIYRNGHLQNSLTIDHSILEKTEIIFGPNSLMYGSDAIGGTILYFTKNPELLTNDSTIVSFQGNAFVKQNISNGSSISHIDFSLGRKKIAYLGSFTNSNYENIVMGKVRNSNYPKNFGQQFFYTYITDSNDIVVNNRKPEIQRYTEYTQFDHVSKLLISPLENLKFTTNIQYSNSSNINRYDDLNDFDNNEPKYSESYYGPQERIFIAEHIELKNDSAIMNQLNASIAYQNIEESRNSRKFQSDNLLSQIENLQLISTNIDIFSAAKYCSLYYGAESNYNILNSEAFYQDIHTQAKEYAQTRYPNNESYTFDAAIYFSVKKHLTKKIVANAGFRYTLYWLQANFTPTALVVLPFTQIAFTSTAPSGTFGLVYNTNGWKFSALASSGFRNANLDDIGKIRAKNSQILIPSGNISPEFAYNTEVGIDKKFRHFLSLNLTVFSTWISDVITRVPYSINNIDSLMYDGELYGMYTNKNEELAQVYGISGSLNANLLSHLLIKGTINYTQGVNKSQNTPLGHIPPLFGRTSVEWTYNKIVAESYIKYNGWKKIEDMSPTGEDNNDYGTEEGFPSWWTLNARIKYQLGNFTHISIAGENLLDTYYRSFASVISGPGRNISVSLTANLK